MHNKAMQPSGMFSFSRKHWDAHNFNKRQFFWNLCWLCSPRFTNPVVLNGKKPAAPFSPRRRNSASFFRLKRAWSHKGCVLHKHQPGQAAQLTVQHLTKLPRHSSRKWAGPTRKNMSGWGTQWLMNISHWVPQPLMLFLVGPAHFQSVTQISSQNWCPFESSKGWTTREWHPVQCGTFQIAILYNDAQGCQKKTTLLHHLVVAWVHQDTRVCRLPLPRVQPSETSPSPCLHPLGLAVLQLSGMKILLASRRTCGSCNGRH